ncbi:hypothetical protein [Nocardiopsis listeri]|uniref:hypothetical protein n=1 Tax=Nocardiopsis listeri TaxID=53440 RepID=UPI0008328B7E|nr:hypothetical protein [Nocardiopsis listeri]
MSNATIPMDLRRVLDAPRGHRFNHTPHRAGTRPAPSTTPHQRHEPAPDRLPPLVSLGRTPRERALLAQMPDTPGLRRRLERGDLPEWMRLAAARRAEEPDRPQPLPWWHDQAPDRTPEPNPAPAPTPAPEPVREPEEETEPARPLSIPRPRREQAPPPPLPRRSDRPRRPASHRKPRRRIGHLVTGYALAALAGAAAQPLITLLS